VDSINSTSDVTFIGSGISTSFSLINFLELVNNEPDSSKKIHISIIEKYSEFNLGIPYGSRSGFSTLLITSLRNFLIEPERSLFIKWLNKNKIWLLDELIKEGGALSEKWVNDNEDAIQNNNWEDLFIPRRFFGCYLNHRVHNKIEALTQKGLIHVSFIQGEVLDIEKNNTQYNIFLKNSRQLKAKKVILSIGSLPVKYLWKNEEIIEDKNLMFLNNPYNPELGVSLNKISDFINERKRLKATNILIVGANASALELLYKVNDNSNGTIKNTTFTFLSTQGTVPDSLIDEERQKDFIPNHLIELKTETNLTVDLVAEATFKDLDAADKIKLGPASTVEIISKHFGVLLEDLSTEDLEIFACKYGNEIGRRQRCAGLHYSNVITDLEKENRFNHISGRFIKMEKDSHNDYYLHYKDTLTSSDKILEKPFHLVINCVGSNNLNHQDIPALHKNVIDKGYCIPNSSKIGFHVNSKLEARPNLHIMGPMLAGNVIDNKAVWHVEHCGRIIWLSKVLSKILYDDLFPNVSNSHRDYSFEAKNLNTEFKIQKYKVLLNTNWNNNIYYSYDHLKYFENKTSSLKYFLLKINGQVKIIMPIILRQIIINKEPSNYYDAITPYGYSGPLCEENTKESDLKEFWKNLDIWYKENNVISEFIRFNLNKNYLGYNGLLISTLNNVIGKLRKNFDNQWTAFLPKVRNNYRKAVSSDLIFKIFNDYDINEDAIKIFYNIYTETMIRHNAKAIYFFTLDYFKNLILNNLNEFALAVIFKDNNPISVELIIKRNDTIFAFLGGTDANYYSYRPNDFLRVEVIKWAIKSNYNYYVLGGGLNDGDGLYKSKKGFFPKDEDEIFYTGRKIINHEVYENLCKNQMANYSDIHKDELKNYFFPLYRFNNR
jgi:uncharacterized NAD(P)/FAD-binding protein YdhS